MRMFNSVKEEYVAFYKFCSECSLNPNRVESTNKFLKFCMLQGIKLR